MAGPTGRRRVHSSAAARPALIAHADWSKFAAKRWICTAQLRNGRYAAMPAEPVGDASRLLEVLLRRAAGGSVLIGFDFPIGLPRAFAKAAGIRQFGQALPLFGKAQWAEFFSVAQTPGEISVRRPFYPHAPGGKNRDQLLKGLKFADADELYRVCERRTPTRAAASCLFWTLGAKQAGRAAIAGWTDVLQPAIEHFGTALGLWPFDGSLTRLLISRRIVVCETYPANGYAVVGLNSSKNRWSKRRPSDRRAGAPALLRWARNHSIDVASGLARQIREGFGDRPEGEDAFDSAIGLFSMIDVLQNRSEDEIPLAAADLAVEGWMLGHRT
jgi:hypothetical protein